MELGDVYTKRTVSEIEHEANIIALADALSAGHGDILINRRFRIGTSQKALNLYLKFLWCLGKLPNVPHHCPVDRVVLSDIPLNGSWTQLDDISTYRNWVSSIRQTAGAISVPEWELEVWNRTVLRSPNNIGPP